MELDSGKLKEKTSEILNILKGMSYQEAEECIFETRKLIKTKAKL